MGLLQQHHIHPVHPPLQPTKKGEPLTPLSQPIHMRKLETGNFRSSKFGQGDRKSCTSAPSGATLLCCIGLLLVDKRI